MHGEMRRRHSQSRVLQPPRSLPTKTVMSTMRHSASSPQGISHSLPVSILKDGHFKAMSEKPTGFKEMRKGRRISSENNAYPSAVGTTSRVTFDASMPLSHLANGNHVKGIHDAESVALRALRNRRTSLPVNTHHAEMAPSNIAEARGLIFDMLADRDLPSNVTTCLKAVVQLLNAPSSSVNSFYFADLGLPRVVENPYSGEQLLVSTVSKPRVSNITFSTVTSATGLPTIAVEPSRPRSSSYWKPHDTASVAAPASSDAVPSNGQPLSPSSSSTTTAPVKTPSSSKPATATPSPVSPSPHSTDPTSLTTTDTTVAPATLLSPGGPNITSESTSTCRSPAPIGGNRVSFVLDEFDSDESAATTTTAPSDASTPLTIRVPDGTVFETEDLERDRMFTQVAEWSFPIFHIAERYKYSILTRMTYKVFKKTDLFNVFKLPYDTFFTFFHALELGYWDIPYHNRIHAADVLHACYYLTVHKVKPTFGPPDVTYQKAPISSYMSPLELMALFTAAAMHDYDHPGRTNAFLVASEDCKAILYNDRSVLENHHAAESWRLLCKPGNNFINNLDGAETKRFRYLVLEYILATDLKQHFDIICQYTEKIPHMNLESEADRVLIAQTLIKLADVNSPAKPASLHQQWTKRICQEFYLQGDDEKRLNLQVSPYMDRAAPNVPKLQDSFISHIVSPLVIILSDTGMLPEQPGLNEPEIILNLENNHQKWLREIAAARIASGEVDEDENEEGEPLANGTHPPSMQCLPEEESEDSCSNSGTGTLNNNTDECVQPLKNQNDLNPSNRAKQPKENGAPKSVEPILVNGNGTHDTKSPPSEPSSSTSDTTLGKFEKKLGISKKYFASMLKFLPSSSGSSNSSSNTSASGSATPTATPKFHPKRQPRSKSVSVASSRKA